MSPNSPRIRTTNSRSGLVSGALTLGLVLSVSPVLMASATANPTVNPTASSTVSPSASPSGSAQPSATPSSSVSPTGTASPTLTPSGTTSPTPNAPVVPPTLRLGSKGKDVKRLQSRLNQLGLHDDHITRTFDADTQLGVSAFQRSKKLKGKRGVAGKKFWLALFDATREPTANELNNVYKPGKAILKRGSQGKAVRNLEARLVQVKSFRGKVDATYDKKTAKAVRVFQAKTKIPVTGKVDARTLQRLTKVTRKPNRTELFNLSVKGPALDERCKTGRVLCISKTDRSLRWVVNGVVKMRMDARFGDVTRYPTREGEFKVYWKSRDHVSSLYDSPMPFAMFFSGGQAVHYSVDFLRRDYSTSSHGCVNIRDRAGIEKLFNLVRVNDKVVVYK